MNSKRIISLILCFSFIIQGPLFAEEEQAARAIPELEQLAKAHPTEDLEKAIEQGDYRFLAVMIGTFAAMRAIPGIDYEKEKKNIEKYGVRIIADLSGDVMDDEQIQRLNLGHLITAYAKEYNQLLLEEIGMLQTAEAKPLTMDHE